MTNDRRELLGVVRQVDRKQMDVLRHSLGLTRSAISYRNYYAAPSTGDAVCESLVDLGLMVPGNTYNGGCCYHVTPLGIKVANTR